LIAKKSINSRLGLKQGDKSKMEMTPREKVKYMYLTGVSVAQICERTGLLVGTVEKIIAEVKNGKER